MSISLHYMANKVRNKTAGKLIRLESITILIIPLIESYKTIDKNDPSSCPLIFENGP